MRTPLTVDLLAKAFAYCEARATPHRLPDFEYIRGIAKDGGNTEVLGTLVMVEEHNTGYPGDLERWLFKVETKDGEKVQFWADMIPGQIT